MPAAVAPERLTFHPLTPDRWDDLVRLFGERGACAGCWCMFWRLPSRQWTAGKGASNKRAFRKLVSSGEPPGVIAYAGRVPVGWCAVAPRPDYGFLERSRVLAPVDERPVWSISCLFVLRTHRRRGVSVRLLRAACEFAAGRGARIVEGYPVEPRQQRAPATFLWNGTLSAFRRAGFREVLRRSETRPIVRRALRRSRKA